MSGFEMINQAKNLGKGEAEFSHFAVDFWDDNAFLGDEIYPSGHFVVALLNIEKNDCEKHFVLTQSAEKLIVNLKNNFIIDDFNEFKKITFALHKFVRGVPPYSLLDTDTEFDRLEDSFGDASLMFIESNKDFIEFPIMCARKYIEIVKDINLIRNELIDFFEQYLSKIKTRNENSFASALSDFYFSGGFKLFYTEQFKNKENTLYLFPEKAHNSFMRIVTKHPTENKTVIAQRFYFNSLKDFIVNELMNCLHYSNSFSQCEICEKYFLNTSARNPKYCDGFVPNHAKRFTCRQEAAARGRKQKENSTEHPIKKLCDRRLNTINKHKKSGTISEEFAKKAKALAQQKRDRALYDNDYFLTDYETEISQKRLYEEVTKLLG